MIRPLHSPFYIALRLIRFFIFVQHLVFTSIFYHYLFCSLNFFSSPKFPKIEKTQISLVLQWYVVSLKPFIIIIKGDGMIVSHSSKWKALKEVKNKTELDDKNGGKNDDGQNSNSSSGSSGGTPTSGSGTNVVRTVEGGYKSLDDDYTYVRGRGRGRYVCNSCGIRCKKPSMLKKHIRTHSNFRPYTCK